MNRIQSEFEVWGTIVFVECASSIVSAAQLQLGIDTVQLFCKEVDEVFSTYKDNSQISQLRHGQLHIEECDENVKEVWDLCLQARYLSDGAFNPWAVAGGFDPSGLVKGWAADKCAEILQEAGAQHIHVNAAGDLALRGGYFDETTQSIQPWSIGVVNPDDRMEVLQVFKITDGAIANLELMNVVLPSQIHTGHDRHWSKIGDDCWAKWSHLRCLSNSGYGGRKRCSNLV